ncbi:hypothetical protein PF919_003364 [Salmonella enterica]|nr:hypothetical protein [Salmonella enterica subsp. enterica]EEW8377326.1 hypothetical protein [Salmonella enterica]HCM6245901.1 hypothetical protein [Salmonella enterica subsp. enterica serovar 45:b:-]EHB7109103.1 hypothetical protein [Salmonella enterica]EHO7718491.1 hypothetical protein [Salmonella enterica]
MKLTDKPLSFGYSVVDSHSSCRPVKAKTRRSGFYEEVKLTDKSRFLLGIASWTVIHPAAL